jgi:hypothetical protein
MPGGCSGKRDSDLQWLRTAGHDRAMLYTRFLPQIHEDNMTEIIRLPDNFIGREDREKLESFAGHIVARGRAVRWHWDKDAAGNDIFEIQPVGVDHRPAVQISRNRTQDAYAARDTAGRPIVKGALDHVFAELEAYFIRLHGEGPDRYA